MATRKERMTLNTAGYTPAVFNGIKYTPVTADYGILERAFAINEEREKEAITEHNAIKTALGKVRTSLHQDSETLKWFDDKAKDIEDKINNAVIEGDFFNAIALAKNAAGDLANDAELLGRIQNNKQYEAEMQRIQKMVAEGKLSENEANYYRKNNPFNNKFIKEGDKIIGAEQWKLNEEPVERLDINKLFQESAALYKPNHTGYTNTSNFQSTKTDNISGSTTTKMSMNRGDNISTVTETIGHSEQNVDPVDLLNFSLQRLYATENWERKLRQHFNGEWQHYQDLKKEVSEYTGDTSNSDYIAKKAHVEKYEQLFEKDGVPKRKDANTYMIYFANQLFNSEQVKAYGYKFTEDQHSLIGQISVGSDNKAKVVDYNPIKGYYWREVGPNVDVIQDTDNTVIPL